MRVVTFLLFLLGTVSAGFFNSEEYIVDSSESEESGSAQFPKCDACMANLVNLQHEFVHDPSGTTNLKDRLASSVCQYNRYDEMRCREFIENVDNDKLAGFIYSQLDKVQALCGVSGDNDQRMCTQEPTSRRSLLQFVANQFSNLTARSSDDCRDIANQLRTLLQEQDAQNELKEYSKAACNAVKHWSEAGSDADWCNEAIDRYWEDILKVFLSILDISDSLVCFQYLGSGRKCHPTGQQMRRLIERRYPLLHRVLSISRQEEAVEGYSTKCVMAKLVPPKVKQILSASLEGGKLKKIIRFVKNSGAKLCDLMVDDKVEPCRAMIDGFVEQVIRRVITDHDREMRAITSLTSLCPSDSATRIEEMSDSDKNDLACDTCKKVISDKMAKLREADIDGELDRWAANGICELIMHATCDDNLLLNDCESLEYNLGPAYFTKLAEYIIKIEDQSCDFQMNVCGQFPLF